jgi:hypothetical protein
VVARREFRQECQVTQLQILVVVVVELGLMEPSDLAAQVVQGSLS